MLKHPVPASFGNRHAGSSWRSVARLLVLPLVGGVTLGLPPAPVSAAPGFGEKSVPVSPVATKAQPLAKAPDHVVGTVVWPTPASAVIDVPAAGLRGTPVPVGGLPVRVSAVMSGDDLSSRGLEALAEPAPASVRVEVLDRAAAQAAGSPVAFKLSRADGGTGPAKVRVEVDVNAFRQGFGGAWMSRLGLRLVPLCALSAVPRDQANQGACAGVELVSVSDFTAGVVSADVDLNLALPGSSSALLSSKQQAMQGQEAQAEDGEAASQGEMVVMLTSGNQADGVGTFGKSDLKETGTWSHTGASGNFTYSYPLSSPPVPGGLAPKLGLNYSSATVDGQTAAEHLQNGPLGEGWSLSGAGFIEQTFRPCKLDYDHSPRWTNATNDPCVRLENFQLSWSGRSGELVPTGTPNVWKVASDDGAKVEYLLSGGATPHWRVTTTDGTQYYFGRQRLPGWTTGARETQSLLTQEVWSNHDGEICMNTSSYMASHCHMGYRWLLDYVVDVHGNSMSYWYTRAMNLTGSNNSGQTVFWYARDAVLDRIEYGTRAGTEATTTTPPAMVDFTNSDRCLADCGTEAAPNTANWVDTPWDKKCTAAPCNSNISPSYWTTKRLTKITTKVWTGTGTTYKPVDEWAFVQRFPGGTDVPTLWLDSIVRTGFDDTGASLAMPSLFTYGRLDPNRADYDPNAGMANPMKYRIYAIDTEAGGRIEVSYMPLDDQACIWWSGKTEGQWPNYNHNYSRCFQQWVVNRSGQEGWSWWHKYVVNKITERDLVVSTTPPIETSYTYSSEGATSTQPLVLWGYSSSVWASPKKAMSSWKGWPTVTTTTGTGGTQSITKRLYYRGLDRDTGLNTGQEFFRQSKVKDSEGTEVVDHPALGGQLREEIVYNGSAEISKTIYTQAVVATSAGGALPLWQTPPERYAYLTGATSTKQLTKIHDGSWRAAQIDNTYETTFGTLTQVSDLGQTSPTLDSDDVCTKFTYNRNTSRNVLWHQGISGTPINQIDRTAALASGNVDFTGYREVMSPGDFSGDGKPDIVAISLADGKAYLWQGNGSGGLQTPPTAISPDWNVFTKMFSTGDVTGDGRPDLLLMTAAGDVWRAPNVNGNNTGGGTLVQSGWSWANRLFSPGDVTGDSIGDVYLRNSAGELWLAPGTGGGYFGGGSLHGNTWNTYDLFAGRGDVTGDGKTDIYTYDPVDTSVWVHHGNGTGGFTGTKTKVVTGLLERHALVAPGDVNADSKPDLWTVANSWLTGAVGRSEILGVNCAATPSYPADLLSDSRIFYDSGASETQPPVRALVTKTELADSHNGTSPSYITSGQSGYDAWGRQIWAKDPLGNQTDTVYTHNGAGLVAQIKVTSPPPVTGGAAASRHETMTTLDVLRGQPLTVTDPNGKVTTGTYDQLGRVKTVRNPGNTGTFPDVAYTYSMTKTSWPYVETKVLGPNGNQIVSYDIYDGLLRARQVQTTAPDGKRSIADTQYDDRGLVVKQSVFYNNAGAPNATLYNAGPSEDAQIERQTRYIYDGAGRQTASELYKQNTMQFRTTTAYEGDRIGVTPPAGGTPTQGLYDARGQVYEQRQFSGTPFSGNSDKTKYEYDKAGRLAKVTDPANNEWTYHYDLLGRQIRTVDPDAGTSESTYDNAGNVKSTKDGRGQLLYYEYDNLGRLTTSRATSVGGQIQGTWTYDTLVEGQLTSTSRFDGATTYTTSVGGYDDGYRPLSVTETIPGFGPSGGTLSYTVSSEYKTNGALYRQHMPAVGGLPAESLTYTYSDQGFAQTMSSGQATYIDGSYYTYDGLLRDVYLGAASGNQVEVMYLYDGSTRRLNQSEVATKSGGAWTVKRFVDTYNYDLAGNITAIAGKKDDVADQEECFRYDYLRRLTEAWTQTDGTCTTAQRTGADPYWRQWPATGGFDTIGNRLQQIDKDTAVGDTTWTYQHGGTDSCTGAAVKPHQLRQVAATGPKAGTPSRTFCYDTAGNMIKRTTEAGVQQDLEWDFEGHLKAVREGATTVASYLYDNGGNRLIANTGNKSTLYLADGTELEKIGTADPLGRRYYGVAVRDAAGLKWTISNHQGSNTIQIDALTLASSPRRFMPYGEPRGTQPGTWVGAKGYVGGTKDDTGLTHLGAREYDPTLGRFISVDPIMDLGDPQQWNAYSYSNNSPATFSDPSGAIYTEFMEEDLCPGSNGRYHCAANMLKWDEDAQKILGTRPPASPEEQLAQTLGCDIEVMCRLVAFGYSIEEARVACQDPNSVACVDALIEVATAGHGKVAGTFIDHGLNRILGRESYEGPPTIRPVTRRPTNTGGDVTPSELDALRNRPKKTADPAAPGPTTKKKTDDDCHSFDPETPVLMADGTTKAIKDVQLGDEVVATDPESGVTQPKTVTDLHVNQDKDLASVTIQNLETGEISVLETTWNHPFWNASDQTWTFAADLGPGTRLRDDEGGLAQRVVAVRTWTGLAEMRDLTVADVHTYFVLAGSAPVLVHNCPPDGTDKIADLTLGPSRPSSGITAEHGDRVLPHEQEFINGAGDEFGCSTCPRDTSGWRDGHWTGDHNPANKLMPDGPWTLYPQCMICARSQGGVVNGLNRGWYRFDDD